MSKSRSLAVLRVGFALCHEQLIQGLIRMKDSFNSYPIDRLALSGAYAAMEDVSYFKETTAKIIATRDWTTIELNKLGFHILPSATNFLFVSHPTASAKTLHETLRRKDILVRYFDTNKIDNFLRITIGSDEEMKMFVNELKQILED